MSANCSCENGSSDADTYKVHFEYRPGNSTLDTDMRIFFDAKRYNLKKDESLDVEVPAGEYRAAFKSSILGTNIDVNVKKDINIILGWDSAGKISVKVN